MQNPTRWSYVDQLKIDAVAWKTLAIWTAGTLSLVVGFTHQPVSLELVGIGLAIWGWYLRMLVFIVRGRKQTQLFEVTVHFSEIHPRVSTLGTGLFRIFPPGITGHAVLPTWAVERTRVRTEPHRVLIAYQPGSEFHFVIGVRPPPSAQAASTDVSGSAEAPGLST
jgi:hypothetical protein